MNKTASILGILLIFLGMCLSTGCSKPTIGLVVASQSNVNPDHSGRPSPVVVKIYELRNDLTFKQADFHSLFDTPLQVLGADLIAANEIVFIPGEARRVLYQPNPSTTFVGVVAGFRQMDRALWRVIKPVDSKKATWVAMELNDASILVLPDKEAKDWDPEKAVRQFQQQLNRPLASDGSSASPQIGSMNQQIPSSAPGSEQSSLASALDEAVTGAENQVEQGAKEIITVINSDGVEMVPTIPQGGNVPSPALPPTPSSLPSMRSF